MTLTQAKIVGRLLKQAIYNIRRNGGNKDTFILDELINVFNLLLSTYKLTDKEL